MTSVLHRSTLSQTSPGFCVSAVTNLFKTLREKEKLFIMSNFCFSHSVFYPFGELTAISIKFKTANSQFGKV